MVDNKKLQIRIPDEAIYRKFLLAVVEKHGTTYAYAGIELCNAMKLWLKKNDHNTPSSAENSTHTHNKSDKDIRVKKVIEHLKNYEYPEIKIDVLRKFIITTGISDHRSIKNYISFLIGSNAIKLKSPKVYYNFLYEERKNEEKEKETE